MLLGEIAQIKIGLVLARKKASEYDIQAEYNLITTQNIESYGIFNDMTFDPYLSNEKLEEQYFTREGDVLIQLNHPHTSVSVGKNQSGLLIPSYYARIRLQHHLVITSDFLAFYLNTKKVKVALLKSQSGSRIHNTNKKVLENLEIPLISLEEQSFIVEMQQLHIQEKRLLHRLITQKEILYMRTVDMLLNRNGEDLKSDSENNAR